MKPHEKIYLRWWASLEGEGLKRNIFSHSTDAANASLFPSPKHDFISEQRARSNFHLLNVYIVDFFKAKEIMRAMHTI
jgi:hypothetical protein